MLFGTSGIRGIYGQEVTPALALKVGNALGQLFPGKILVGMDTRSTSPLLSQAAISGILSSGSGALFTSLTTTPALALASKKGSAGLMITASHNPPEYNGIKLWQNSGMSFVRAQEKKIEERIEQQINLPWDKIGKYNEQDVNSDYIDYISSKITLKKPLKIVLDPASGATTQTSPQVFEKLNCEVLVLNGNPGPIPPRPWEPSEENLDELKSEVKNSKADLGIAHDGDGDRLGVIDEKGNFVSQDVLLTLMAQHYGGKVVVPVNTSALLDDTIGSENVIRTRVGDVAVAEELIKTKSKFGGEPSGCWIHPKIHLCPDGTLSAAVLSSIVSEKGKLSSLTKDFPKYTTLHEKIPLSCNKKDLMAQIEKDSAKYDSVNTIDGIRVDTEQGWFLIRPSGTEPILRITAESKDIKTAKSLLEEARRLSKC